MENLPTNDQSLAGPVALSEVAPSRIKRTGQIVLGVILVLVGIVLSGPGIPGPGLITILFGLNLIKPNNRLYRWVRKKAPGVPDEGPIPTRQIIVFSVITVIFVAISILFGSQIMAWFRQLVGI